MGYFVKKYLDLPEIMNATAVGIKVCVIKLLFVIAVELKL